MKLLLLVVCASVALAAYQIPNMKSNKARKDDPDCGLYAKKEITLYKPVEKESFWCEMCYDLVSVFEMYADCDEAYQDEKADENCDKKYLPADPLMDQICRQVADDLFNDLRNDTDVNPDSECSKLLHAKCNSTTFTFVL